MVKVASEKKTCLKCGNDYAVSSFYSHRNSLIHERFGFCKRCVKENVDLDNMDTLYGFLRTMDIPYLREFWKMANEAQNETIGTYLKNLNSLKQNKELRFRDSDDITGKTSKAELMDYDDFVVTDTIIKRWGRNLEIEDYIFLEEEFETLGGFEADTTIQERLCKNMARTQWMGNKALEEGDHNKYEKMMKTLSSQMNDANIKPVQIKSASQDGAIASWSEWTKLIEDTEPILEELRFEPKFIRDYIERFFVVQMQRILGKIKDEDIKKLEGEI